MKEPLHVGTVINGRYLLQQRIGAGASGEVFLVHDGILQQRVAMKILTRRMPTAEGLAYFKSEFATLTQLRHPHITQVYDFAHDDDHGYYFFTSEYVDGTDYSSALRGLPLAECLPLIGEALDALAYLHGHQILHLDIKPQNVLVTQGDTRIGDDAVGSHVKLIDFGLAAVSHQHRVVGTPSYMAPEIIERASADHRADLYSFGVLLYYVLTGINPYRSTNREATFAQHLRYTPPPPSVHNPDISSLMDTLILRLLAKRREDRFPSASAVRQALASDTDHRPLPIGPDTVHAWEPTFVGRRREMAMLDGWLHHIVETGTPRPLLYWIGGTAGAGKTRFLQEIKYQAQLLGFATHRFDRIDLMARMHWLAAIDQSLAHLNVPALFFLDEAVARVDEGYGAEIVASLRAVIQSLRTALPHATVDHPLRVAVIMTGPAEEAGRHRLAAALGLPPSETGAIILENFSREEVRQVLEQWRVMTGMTISPNQVHRISAGNPSAMMHALRHTDPLQAPTSHARTLHPTVQHPRDHPDREEILNVLAVSQQPLTTTGLHAILERPPSPSALEALIELGIVHRDPVTGDYAYVSPAAREGHYAQINTSQRAIYHARIAAQLQHSPSAPMEELIRHLTEATSDTTVLALWQLYHEQMRGASPAAALETLAEVERLLPSCAGGGPALEILLLRAQSYAEAHQFHAALQCECQIVQGLAQYATLAPLLQERLVTTLSSIGMAAYQHDQWTVAEEAYARALHLLPETPEAQSRRVVIEHALAMVWLARGATEAAIAALERTTALADHGDHTQRPEIAYAALGDGYLAARRYDDAMTHALHERERAERFQQPLRALSAQWLQAAVAHREGQHADANALLTATLPAMHAQGHRELLARTYLLLGQIYSAQHALTEAFHSFQEGSRYAALLGNRSLAITCAMEMGNNHRRRGEIAEAETIFRTALAELDVVQGTLGTHGRLACQLHYHLGSLALRQQRHAQARYHLEKAAVLGERSHGVSPHIRYRIHLSRGELYRILGDTVSARAILRRAKALLVDSSPSDQPPEMPGLFTIQHPEESIINPRSEQDKPRDRQQ